MSVVNNIADIAGMITAVLAVCGVIVSMVVQIRQIREGQKCLLRSEMLRIYYKYLDQKVIRQYEYENFGYLYKAYKALRGNSFIDHVNEEVMSWEVKR